MDYRVQGTQEEELRMTRQVTPFHFIGSGEVARTEEREEKI